MQSLSESESTKKKLWRKKNSQNEDGICRCWCRIIEQKCLRFKSVSDSAPTPPPTRYLIQLQSVYHREIPQSHFTPLYSLRSACAINVSKKQVQEGKLQSLLIIMLSLLQCFLRAVLIFLFYFTLEEHSRRRAQSWRNNKRSFYFY